MCCQISACAAWTPGWCVRKAVRIAFNAKCQRYAVCSAMETLLVARGIADRILPVLAEMYQEQDVELRGCSRTRQLLPDIKAATEEDWRTDYEAPILSIRVVDDLDAAVDHIAKYGSQHTDAIVTEDIARAGSCAGSPRTSSAISATRRRSPIRRW
jgi:glutamate-5-semialdehyde dehydrogenase